MIVIPLIIPFLIWGAVVLIGGLTVAGVAGVAGAFDDPRKNKLGILGMQGAGKTCFLRFLQKKPFIEGTTGRDSYDEFKYKLDNDKEIFVSAGIDLGGENLYWGEYNRIIKDNDLILYFFDIDKYIKNPNENGEYYQRGCNSRFEHIYSSINKHIYDVEIANNESKRLNKSLDNLKTSKTVTVIATHRDKCKLSDSEMNRAFESLIQNKSYKGILKDLKYINLTNRNELQNLVNVIFNNK